MDPAFLQTNGNHKEKRGGKHLEGHTVPKGTMSFRISYPIALGEGKLSGKTGGISKGGKRVKKRKGGKARERLLVR